MKIQVHVFWVVTPGSVVDRMGTNISMENKKGQSLAANRKQEKDNDANGTLLPPVSKSQLVE
jgi:hypothetical protein